MREKTFSSKHRLYVSIFFSLLDGGIEKILYFCVAIVELANIFSGVFLRTSELLGESKGTDTVDDSKIDRFCNSPFLSIDIFFLENEFRRRTVDVDSFLKTCQKIFVSAHESQKTHFNLRVVKCYEKIIFGIKWNKCFSYFPRKSASSWDVLQIGSC